LINAQAKDIAIIPSVSYGTAVAAQNLPLNEGDKILVLAEEFPSNLYAWRVKAKAQGASLVMVQRPANNDWTRAVLRALQDNVIKVAVIPQTHWIDGGYLDLVRIAAARQQYEFALVVDLTQSLGVLGLDVQSIQADFLICASYKWLLGPYSFGFLYVDPRHHRGIPLEYGWINRPGAHDFSRLIDYTDDINTDATRFDMGERANMQLTPIVIAGLEQIHEWGQANIEASLAAYTAKLSEQLAALGFVACDKAYRSPHYLSVKHSGGLPDNLLSLLANEQIYVSRRGDNIRISPHLYNNAHDAAQLTAALAKVVSVR
ncbi:MAG: aminotransferase class V-fold PLP-dependent enzyme, partial [Methylococcales bacterium]|nr:aminotransferase class V-fold PLP-dependent enzyme [Methylococcales bacterium]